MIRLIASDMDETFLGAGHRVPAPNVDALARLRELGVAFVPCSGRPYPSIAANLEELDQRLFEGGHVIAFNGGFIHRYGDPTPLTSRTLDHAVAEDLYRRGFDLGCTMHVYVPSGLIHVQHLHREERGYLLGLSGIRELSDSQRDLSFLGEQEVVKILYMCPDPEQIRRLGESLRPTLDPSKVWITYSSRRYAEFVPAGVDKGAGLRSLANMMGIDMAETMAVGDAANDIAMLDAAATAVGVANVTDDARPHCDVVLDTDADGGALREIVERFIEPEHR